MARGIILNAEGKLVHRTLPNTSAWNITSDWAIRMVARTPTGAGRMITIDQAAGPHAVALDRNGGNLELYVGGVLKITHTPTDINDLVISISYSFSTDKATLATEKANGTGVVSTDSAVLSKTGGWDWRNLKLLLNAESFGASNILLAGQGSFALSGQPATLTHGGGGGSFPVNSTPLDNFNRADANPLDGSFTQGIQGAYDGQLRLLSNKIRAATPANTSAMARATWNTGLNADQEVFATIANIESSADTFEVWGRLNNAGASGVTGYAVSVKVQDGTIRAGKWNSDVSADELGSWSVSPAVGDSFGFSLIGTLGTVYYKTAAGVWTAKGTFLASAYTGSGKIGIGVGGSDPALYHPELDDFGGGNI
jgi:hypothetical protein